MSIQAQKIYDLLDENAFEVYFPAQKVGDALTKYVVVAENGGDGTRGVARDYFDILCYVPEEQYSTMNDFVVSVETCLKKLYPKIKSTYTRTSPYHDTDIKAWMVSVEYQNWRKT